MNRSVDEAIRRAVEQSIHPEDLRRRVLASFGEGLLSHARQIAAETKGYDWLRQDVDPSAESRDTSETATVNQISAHAHYSLSPSRLVVMVGMILLAIVLLFPPFVVPLPQGLLNNAGFAFILLPPQSGSVYAVVNVPLLAVLASGVAAVTAAGYFLARSLEASC